MRQPVFVQQLPTPAVTNSFYPLNPSLGDELMRLFAYSYCEKPQVQVENTEDIWEEFRHNGRDYEYCPDVADYTLASGHSRRKKNKKPLPTECVFCRNNGEQESYYRKHILKDSEGRVMCPVLRAYECPLCGAYGDVAHTRKYCPLNTSNTSSPINAMKYTKNSIGRRRSK